MPKKKKGKLESCPYCKQPLHILEWDLNAPLDEERNKEYQGPTTNPEVLAWCEGHCYSVMAIPMMGEGDLVQFLDKLDTMNLTPKKYRDKTRQAIKKCFKWMNKELSESLAL